MECACNAMDKDVFGEKMEKNVLLVMELASVVLVKARE